MKILALSGSLRRGSLNTRLLQAAASLAEHPVRVVLHDYSAVPFYNEDLDNEQRPVAVEQLLDAIAESDALLLATPEYNHSVTAVLKNAIDWASRPAFESVLVGKPTGMLSASMSAIGGARAQQHWKTILASTLTPVFPATEYLLASAQRAFDAEGLLNDEASRQRLAGYVKGFAEWAGNVSESKPS